MKKYLGIMAFLALLIASCTGDNTGINIPCETPSNFAITDYNNLVEVDLGWDENEDADSWRIEYDLSGFTLGEGTAITTETNSATINGLDFNQAYDFYIRTKCDDGFSDWLGPVTNTPEEITQSDALMTANIKGVQYDYLVPFLWGTFINDAISIVSFEGTEEIYIKMQGNSEPQNDNFDTTKEINLFIPESNWALGTYNLGSYFNDSEGNPQPNVNIIYFETSEGNFQAEEGDSGTITITEFNLEDRLIKGTFEFTFMLYDVNTNIETGPFYCLDGTFDYSLDDEYFD